MNDYIKNSMNLGEKMDFYVNVQGSECISYITMIDDIY